MNSFARLDARPRKNNNVLQSGITSDAGLVTDHDVNQLGFSVDRRRLRYDATAVVILQPLHIAVKNVDRTGEVVIPNGHHLGVQRVPVANENIEGNGELVLVTQRSARRARDIIKNVRLECVEATTLKVAARPSRLFRQPRDQTIRADPQLTALPDQPDIRFAYGKYRRGALVEPLYELKSDPPRQRSNLRGATKKVW